MRDTVICLDVDEFWELIFIGRWGVEKSDSLNVVRGLLDLARQRADGWEAKAREWLGISEKVKASTEMIISELKKAEKKLSKAERKAERKGVGMVLLTILGFLIGIIL